VPHVLVPRRAWPDDRFPHWAVAALRAAGARVSESGARADVALVPALRPAAPPQVRAGRVIALADVPARPGDEQLDGVDVVATSAALAAPWPGARVVRPSVKQGVRPRVSPGDDVVRIASVGPLHWSAGHEHALVAVARLGAGVELRIAGDGPAREEILFAAFDLGIEHAVTIAPGAGDDGLAAERAAIAAADVVVVPAVEDRAWTGLLLALATGVPVVASDLPTARELGAPVLVPPRDPAALAAAIGRHGPEPARDELTDLAACGRALLA
jgi:glycosyltransferase involved in cell wall biosynthesis